MDTETRDAHSEEESGSSVCVLSQSVISHAANLAWPSRTNQGFVIANHYFASMNIITLLPCSFELPLKQI